MITPLSKPQNLNINYAVLKKS